MDYHTKGYLSKVAAWMIKYNVTDLGYCNDRLPSDYNHQYQAWCAELSEVIHFLTHKQIGLARKEALAVAE